VLDDMGVEAGIQVTSADPLHDEAVRSLEDEDCWRITPPYR